MQQDMLKQERQRQRETLNLFSGKVKTFLYTKIYLRYIFLLIRIFTKVKKSLPIHTTYISVNIFLCILPIHQSDEVSSLSF